MPRFRHVLLAGILLTLTGCGLIRDRGVGDEHAEGLMENQPLDIGEVQRNYHLYLPDDPEPASIVLLLHGNGGSADQILGLKGTKAPYKIWLDIALRENLILVVPDGLEGPNGKQGWNDCRTDAPTNPDADDVLFLTTLLDDVQDTYNTEAQQVFVAGTSNGGLMTQRLADVVPERLDAAAIVVASRPLNSECDNPSAPVPILFMNGTNDPILPYAGGPIASERGVMISTADTVQYWVDRNGADQTPVETVVADTDQGEDSTIVRWTYQSGPGGAAVEHYEVIGGGHTEPSIEERYSRLFKRITGEQNGDVEMAEEIWRFFDAQ